MAWHKSDLTWGTRPWQDTSVAVPDVVDETEGDAGTAITDAGLKVGAVTSANDAVIALGNVISQSPAAAVVVGQGSYVDLVISLGAA